MLKFVFWALLGANAVLFAYGRGYLGKPEGSEREPARLANQLAPGRLALLTAVQARDAAQAASAPAQAAAPAAPEPARAPTPAPVPPVAIAPTLVACVQTGPLAPGDLRRFESRLARLELGSRQARINVPFQEVSSHMVYLPPGGGKEGADRRAAELKESGIENFYIMQNESPLKWAISLGVFKTEAAAQNLAATLGRQGVRGVRVLPRGPQGNRGAYQFRGIDPQQRTRIAGIADGFAGAQLRDCK
ncbi:SPOR domain-containing protein [Massilia niastensis]|uniref:SPOR domain-containing protein n=1 Tax=Massilia niastensis TaxID=544911 RepID=UPI00039982F6|nr:SPOR domain-containing protein [Massilia niastensis]